MSPSTAVKWLCIIFACAALFFGLRGVIWHTGAITWDTGANGEVSSGWNEIIAAIVAAILAFLTWFFWERNED